jgi:type II secretory pathway component PulF
MSAGSGRHTVTLYRSLSTMLEAGLPLYQAFDFFAEHGEHRGLSGACQRISLEIASGHPLHHAVAREPLYFSVKAVRMMEAGFKGGTLSPILRRLAEDEERTWMLTQRLKSQLTYPLCISGLALLAVVLLPPLALADLLNTVVQMTSEPPALTRALLAFSNGISSPWTILVVLGVVGGLVYAWRNDDVRRWLDRHEYLIWEVPAFGKLWQDIVAVRFLNVFAMSYESGMPATQCLVISSASTGSVRAQKAGRVMRSCLVEGNSLRESLALGGFLPRLTLEAVEAGEQVGKVPDLMRRASLLLEAEVEGRIDAATKFIEPIILGILGLFVAIFALGCLLPIIKLSESI